MGKEGAPSVPVFRLLVHIGFVFSFIHAKDDAIKKIQEVISMGIGLMWNDYAVCAVEFSREKVRCDFYNPFDV